MHIETALRESEGRFRTLFELLPYAAAVTMVETGELLDVNRKLCELTGYRRDEILGRTTTEIGFYSPVDRKRFTQALQEKGEVKDLDMDFRGRDGNVFHALMHARQVQLEGDEVILTVFHDLTDLRRLEDRLTHAQKMEAVGALASGIAHDFNNLLMVIQGHVSLMLLDVDPGDRLAGELRAIEEQIAGGVSLTRQLLGFAGQGKYQVVAADPNDLVGQCSEMFGRTRKDITIDRELGSGVWPVEVDRGQIDQVLLNLFVNAWQAMPEGGRLTLRTSNVILKEGQVCPGGILPGRYVKISVSDTGHGMEEETQRRIFDPFFTTKNPGVGSGLGLASALGIVEQYGGTITVTSALQRGATFDVFLPASARMVETRAGAPWALQPGHGTVLLVDDEEVVREVTGRMLQKLGYRVLAAPGGREALDMFEEERAHIDLVILDMIMPGPGGAETFEALRRMNPSVTILLSSGYGVDEEVARLLEYGRAGFIQKPYTVGEFSIKIRDVLRCQSKMGVL